MSRILIRCLFTLLSIAFQATLLFGTEGYQHGRICQAQEKQKLLIDVVNSSFQVKEPEGSAAKFLDEVFEKFDTTKRISS